ncbi:xylulose 5-phosphate 3-epimerase [Ruegeria sediminis]|uniref:Xylulose 5-phosphate 3-epimerase n=2 Tax=Ruegeria sediminis TaxID=2583820 RepID=A0ABY2X4R7_9RHOB|nr:xylulose 5-phosphate 3-epimerase [Ruegeria sediminis]
MTCGTCDDLSVPNRREISQRAEQYRSRDADFAAWAAGAGVIPHDDLTQVRIHEMVRVLVETGSLPDTATGYRRLRAADMIANAAMWLVVHMTYAKNVRLDGKALAANAFKDNPQGHTGGSLNMVPAYVAYLALNALDGRTRSWMMGQGHCVAAIDAVNLLVGNMTPSHAARYDLTNAGMTRFVSDFYSCEVGPDGSQVSPLGSHVNAHTAGGIQEGGYLGFAELHYVHAPLKGERLVAFLSDGAFEEQRGSDWAPRWWRAEDCGLVAPIMILNGRRIEQRTQIAQQGGERWLDHHLRLNGFNPIGLDGRDPASILWGIYAIESGYDTAAADNGGSIPQERLGYGIAETTKGFGFPGAGTNRAHNLPLPGNPATDAESRRMFNDGASHLHVPEQILRDAVTELTTHERQNRPKERDHPMATRRIAQPDIPVAAVYPLGETVSPMTALDRQFCAIVGANPHLRPRVGNPDELRSNRLDETLDTLKHRVFDPEAGIAESQTGGVITALNEEAVVCAALGNKGGINLVVTYEAFAPKMLGAIRQEITFARQLAAAGRPPGWLSVPIVLTSHAWENAKNEISHQDTTLPEVLLSEMADAVSVLFPPDATSTAAALSSVYRSHGRLAVMVVPKQPVTSVIGAAQAEQMLADGAAVVSGDPQKAEILLSATGAYQLDICRVARTRLEKGGVKSALIYVIEPGRLRAPRDAREAGYVLDDRALADFFPLGVPRLFVTHTRPGPFLGALRRIDSGPQTTRALGFINHGGTLDLNGMLFANRTTWAHVVAEAADLLARPISDFLSPAELAAIAGEGMPSALWTD